MSLIERALTFGTPPANMVGVLSLPVAPQPCGVVIVVGGPQYRAGSHRQFVLLARRLAAAGFPVLRFDYQGMGDSGGDLQDFRGIDKDIDQAISTLLREVPGTQSVCLWGLCDGASAALMYLHESSDARVQSVCLLNPWVRSETSLAQATVKHYYGGRLRDPAFWTKLISGGVGWKAIRGLAFNLLKASSPSTPKSSTTTFQQQMASAWKDFPGRILLLLSAKDLTAQEFNETTKTAPEWRGAMSRRRLTVHSIPEADHTLSRADHRRMAEELTVNWLSEKV